MTNREMLVEIQKQFELDGDLEAQANPLDFLDAGGFHAASFSVAYFQVLSNAIDPPPESS